MSAFKPALVTNLHCDNWQAYHGYPKFSIGFTYQGARYHIWFRDGRDEEVMYKNPPLGATGADHFQPRKLELSKSFGLAVLAWLEPQMARLEAEGKALHEAEIAKAHAKQLEANKEARVRDAAPTMFAVLKDVAALLPCSGRLHPQDLMSLQTRVVAALALAGA
jgi:hypothetical protein